MIPAMSFGQVADVALIAIWRRSVIALCRSPRHAHKRSIAARGNRMEDIYNLATALRDDPPFRTGCNTERVTDETLGAKAVTDRFIPPTGSPRLALLSPTVNNLDELYQMYSDPRLAEADPLIAHPSIAHTKNVLKRWIENWGRDGHGLWVLRTLNKLGPGEFIGVGGCNLLSETAWNLSFSLRPSAWGHGYAQEAAAAGIAQALAVRPHLPITAVVAQGNSRSHRAVERAGL